MNRYIKPITGALIGFILFAAVAAAGTYLYYRFMPGNWFLNYYYAKADDAPVGQDVQLTLCRRIRYDKAHIEATRTFMYQQTSNGQYRPAGEYHFEADVEKAPSPCQPLRISAERHPQQAGTYKFVTEAEFKVQGQRKTIRYESNTYKLIATPQSIQQQIDVLQRQIDDLKSQLQARGATPAPEVGVVPAQGNQAQAQAPAPSSAASNQSQTPPAATQPATSQPQQPTTPPEPPNPVSEALSNLPLIGRLFN